MEMFEDKKGISPDRFNIGSGIFFWKKFSRSLSLDEVSRESGMSKYHFARSFKAVTGCEDKTSEKQTKAAVRRRERR